MVVINRGSKDVEILTHRRKEIGKDDSEFMEETLRLSENSAGVVTCLDTDGSMIMIGTSRYILLWDMRSRSWLQKIHSG